jgi:hypothetical protein
MKQTKSTIKILKPVSGTWLSMVSLMIFLCSCTRFEANAEDLRKIVNLSGDWRFSIGDDIAWSNPSFDDSGWDKLDVPGTWEGQGYDDYNGYAWYRKTFTINNLPANTPVYLLLGRIDDADVIYLNGRKIAQDGKLPPEFKTAYDIERKFHIPLEYFNKDGDNVIAVRVYDSYQDGGIVDGPVGLYYDTDDEFLSLNFNGFWKFHTGDDKAWRLPEVDEKDWTSLFVPSTWESQGYDDYDGYAWYRYKFSLPQNLSSGDLYLSLGKIDDIDYVYLNGEKIGDVYDLKNHRYFFTNNSFISINSDWEYNARRVYKIPADKLKRPGENIIAVRVYDEHGLGGIYQGPVGIMTSEDNQRYQNKHRHSTGSNFWDFIMSRFFNYDNN